MRAQPGARRDAVVGMWQDRVKIAVAAPPVDGKANAALIRFVAGFCGVPVRDVDLVAGAGHRDKTLRIVADLADVVDALAREMLR